MILLDFAHEQQFNLHWGGMGWPQNQNGPANARPLVSWKELIISS
jgi:hypothetical protein